MTICGVTAVSSLLSLRPEGLMSQSYRRGSVLSTAAAGRIGIEVLESPNLQPKTCGSVPQEWTSEEIRSAFFMAWGRTASLHAWQPAKKALDS